MGLIEKTDCNYILKTGETKDKIVCPDKDIEAQTIDENSVMITILKSRAKVTKQ